jgi:YHS domain-containing protein
MRSILFLTLLFSAFILPLSSAHAERWYVDNGGFVSKGTGAVINGYDPVAYFTEGKAVKGNPAISAAYEGGTFFFATPANRDAFQKSPARYMPQYGGYCAYAAGAKDSLVEVDPTVWKIVDGKLYLNYDKDIQAEWEKNQTAYIKQADANWVHLQK